MFKRRQPDSPAGRGPSEESPRSEPAQPSASGEGAPGRTLARRASDQMPGASRRLELREPTPPLSASENEGRKLVVGQGIRLSGEIKKCEKLVVEGEVQANLKDCLTLEIAETGLFNGAAVVDEAEISGCFEGDLTAKARLYVRSTGRILGTIRYADLEIERGGKIAGTVDVTEPEALPEQPPVVQAPAEEDTAEKAARPNGAGKAGNGGSDDAGLSA